MEKSKSYHRTSIKTQHTTHKVILVVICKLGQLVLIDPVCQSIGFSNGLHQWLEQVAVPGFFNKIQNIPMFRLTSQNTTVLTYRNISREFFWWVATVFLRNNVFSSNRWLRELISYPLKKIQVMVSLSSEKSRIIKLYKKI